MMVALVVGCRRQGLEAPIVNNPMRASVQPRGRVDALRELEREARYTNPYGITNIYISPDDRYIALQSKAIFVWDRRDDAAPAFILDAGLNPEVTFTPDSRVLVVRPDPGHSEHSDQRRQRLLYEIDSGRLLASASCPRPRPPSEVSGPRTREVPSLCPMALSNDGRRLAVWADALDGGTARREDVGAVVEVIEVRTGKVVRRFELPKMGPGWGDLTLIYDARDRLLALHNRPQDTEAWSLESNDPRLLYAVGQTLPGHHRTGGSVRLAPGGATVVVNISSSPDQPSGANSGVELLGLLDLERNELSAHLRVDPGVHSGWERHYRGAGFLFLSRRRAEERTPLQFFDLRTETMLESPSSGAVALDAGSPGQPPRLSAIDIDFGSPHVDHRFERVDISTDGQVFAAELVSFPRGEQQTRTLQFGPLRSSTGPRPSRPESASPVALRPLTHRPLGPEFGSARWRLGERLLAIGPVDPRFDAHGVQLFDVETGAAVSPPVEPWVSALWFGADRHSLYAAYNDGVLRRFEARTGESFAQEYLLRPDHIHQIEVSRDGRWVASSSIRLGPPVEMPVDAAGGGARATSPELRVVQLFDTVRHRSISIPMSEPHSATSEHLDLAETLPEDFGLDHIRSVFAEPQGLAQMFPEETLCLARPDLKPGQPGCQIAWFTEHRATRSRDGRYLADVVQVTGSDYLVIWDERQGEVVAQTPIERGSYPMLTFSPRGNVLAVAFYGSANVSLRDTTTLLEIEQIEGHRGPVSAVAFSPDGRTVATSSRDGALLLWAVSPRDAPVTTLAR